MALVLAVSLAVSVGVASDPYLQEGWQSPEAHETAQDGSGEAFEQTHAVGSLDSWPQAVEQWRPLVAGHFGDLGPAAVETALCLIFFESKGNPTADNPTSSATGLFQVLARTWGPRYGVSVADLETPEVNTFIARKLYDDGGWNHWSPYLRGECRY